MKKMKSEKRKKTMKEIKSLEHFFPAFYLFCSVIYFLSFGFKYFSVGFTEKYETRFHFKKYIKNLADFWF